VDLLGNTMNSYGYQAIPGTNEYIIDCQNIQNGTYFLRIRTNDNIETILPVIIYK